MSPAGHGVGGPHCLPAGPHPTATRQPYLAQVPGSYGGRGTRARAPSGRQRPGRVGRWARGAAGSAQGGSEARTGLRPQENKQVFSGREPRPSPLPSAGPLPLPSPGVGRGAWHIPRILPPVASARPTSRPAPPGAVGETEAALPSEPWASRGRRGAGGGWEPPGTFPRVLAPGSRLPPGPAASARRCGPGAGPTTCTDAGENYRC